MIPILLHPGSRIGGVQLNSSDPFAPLLIEPETLGVPEDVNFLMEGRFTRNTVRNRAYLDYTETLTICVNNKGKI